MSWTSWEKVYHSTGHWFPLSGFVIMTRICKWTWKFGLWILCLNCMWKEKNCSTTFLSGFLIHWWCKGTKSNKISQFGAGWSVFHIFNISKIDTILSALGSHPMNKAHRGNLNNFLFVNLSIVLYIHLFNYSLIPIW